MSRRQVLRSSVRLRWSHLVPTSSLRSLSKLSGISRARGPCVFNNIMGVGGSPYSLADSYSREDKDSLTDRFVHSLNSPEISGTVNT
jgi:hypothetical protein